jgi:hypothetical protein
MNTLESCFRSGTVEALSEKSARLPQSMHLFEYCLGRASAWGTLLCGNLKERTVADVINIAAFAEHAS